MSKDSSVLAIGVDAAEPQVVHRLIREGRLPALKELAANGRWMPVHSPARIGSGSVWPTFMSGHAPAKHGAYGEWLWQPQSMRLARYAGNHLIPFWQAYIVDGLSVGILDVPFMLLRNLSRGFEISEWGAHDIVHGQVHLNSAARQIVRQFPTHPLSVNPSASGPDDYRNLETLGEACLEGIKLRGSLAKTLIDEMRPDFSLITFSEIHHAAHYLWHGLEPEHAVYQNVGVSQLQKTRPSMEEIYVELDHQIGELIRTAGDETSVMVFSLHGMQPAYGIPDFLGSWLCEIGMAQLAGWRDQDWKQRARAFFGRLKQRSPSWVKDAYYKILPATATHQLALPTMLPLYDWSRTRAFALPTDQHGWIRINLAGRESAGIVSRADYEETLRELEERLKSLKTEDGRGVVREVIRTSRSVDDAFSNPLPDLVVHWENAVFESLQLSGSKVKTESKGKKFVGQHSLEGFCILQTQKPVARADYIAAEELNVLIGKLLSQETAAAAGST